MDIDLDSKLKAIDDASESFVTCDLPHEIHIVLKRIVLEAKYICILGEDTAEPRYWQKLVDQHDLIGYGYPTVWAGLRCDLADAYEKRGKIKEAARIRRKIRRELKQLDIHFRKVILVRLDSSPNDDSSPDKPDEQNPRDSDGS
jgi:hypothetical protein